MYSLYLRQIFASYQEFKEKLEIYKQETGADYSIRTSISAETATKRKGFPYIDEVTFPLSYVKFGCVHFGRIRNRGGDKSKLADNHNHHPIPNLNRGNCPAFIVISYHSTLKKLVLTSIVHEHDHRLYNIVPKAEVKPSPASISYKDSTLLANNLSIIPIKSGVSSPKVENDVYVVGHTQGGCAIILEKPALAKDVKVNNGSHSGLESGSHSILKSADISKRLEMKQPPAVVSIISPKGTTRENSKSSISSTKIVPEQPQPWDCCYLDIMGPLPKTSAGNTFIVSLTDRCTSWPEAAAIADKHPKFIANFLMDCIGRHGVPKLVASNLDRNFVEKINETLHSRLGIDKCVTKVSSFGNADFSSGTISTLKSILCQYVSGNDEDWDGYLSLCLLALRTRRYGATKFSPFEALYLHEANLPPSLEARLSLADVHVKPVNYHF